MSLRVRSLLAVAVLLTGWVTACGLSQPARGDVFVYVAAPLSGWQAEGGQTVVGGARLAAEQINARGGILGYRVVIRPIDDEADSDVATQVARQVAEQVRAGDRVLGVIGHYNSGQTGAALQTYKDLPIIVITPTASHPDLTKRGYSNFFRVNATDATQGPVDADFLVNVIGARRVVLVYAENEYGVGLRDEIAHALTGLGQPPADVIAIEEGGATHVSVIPRIKKANPDAVFLAGYETEGYVLLPEMREAGLEVPFMASDGCFLYEFIDGAGKWAEGSYVSGITPDPKVVADKDWWQAYQTLEARNPGTYSVAGFSAMMVLAEGVEQAKSLEAANVAQALRGIDLATLVGRVRYDDAGDLMDPRVYVFQVRDGDFEQVYPSE